MDKAELRKIYLAKRRALSPDERDERSSKIAEIFFETFDLAAVSVLHSFLPIQKFNEINTRLILDRIWNEHPHIQIAVPRVDFETNQMVSVKFRSDAEVVRNSWGIDEPAHNEFVDAANVDMVLVPGLCFDRNGHRAGYGKGFYDRFLVGCRADCVKVGLSHFDLVKKIDDVHDGDIGLDFIVTADRICTSQNWEP